MGDTLNWRSRPWTIRVIVGLGVVNDAIGLWMRPTAVNVTVTAIALVLLWGLWRGSPGARLYFILMTSAVVVLTFIALLNEPSQYWIDFVASAVLLTLLLAPPTHRWAREQEERREQARTRRRALARQP